MTEYAPSILSCTSSTALKISLLSNVPFSIGVFTENMLDAVGAGDALLAYSSLSLKVSNSLIIASILGSFAASCACEIEGNNPIDIETIINKIKEVQKKINYIHK